MALRKFMHPRNKYKDGIDFKKMAILYPDFQNHTKFDLSGKLRYNFKNKDSLRELTRTLFKHDFNLDIDVPSDKLVPAVPLRLNYILWIEDLVNYAKLTEIGEIHGIDIGTGAVCVYPLLISKLYGWRMTATEISETSINSAKKNVAKNDLDNLIKVVRANDEKIILCEALDDSEQYSFAMCNPPFFNADKPMGNNKRLPPRNAATGSKVELVVEGGERSFVMRLIDESLRLGTRVNIYTTMLGQKSSCSFFRSELKKRNILNATWTEFCQGHTKRWGLAWTFMPKEIVDLTRAPVIRTRQESKASMKRKDRSDEIIFPLDDKFRNINDLIATIKTWIRDLKIEMKELNIIEDFNGWACQLRAENDTWSHARRKRRLAQRQEHSPKKSCLENCVGEKSSPNDIELKEYSESENTTVERVTDSLLELSLMVGKFEKGDENEKSMEDNLVKICALYEGGHGGKNALETFRQYLINKLNIRQYLLSKSVPNSPRKKRRKGTKIISEVPSTE